VSQVSEKQVNIRVAGVEDLDDVARLFEASVAHHIGKAGLELRPGYDWRRETLLRLERPSSRFLMAYVDGDAAGIQAIQLAGSIKKKSLLQRVRRRFVRGQTSPFLARRSGLLTDVFVFEHYRGRGVGRLLVAGAVEYLAERGYEHVGMNVLATNEPMLNLAASLGFETITNRLILRIQKDGSS